MEEKVQMALDVYDGVNSIDLPGSIIDGDTILSDILESIDAREAGLFVDLMNVWKHSKDKRSVEETFYNLTGTEFDGFVDKVISELQFVGFGDCYDL